jgi:hypothetical protein
VAVGCGHLSEAGLDCDPHVDHGPSVASSQELEESARSTVDNHRDAEHHARRQGVFRANRFGDDPSRGTRLSHLIISLTLGSLLSLANPIGPDDQTVVRPFFTQSEPRWFKGNLHTHTLWSDGNDYPEMVVDWYVQHGYHFLALSEHNLLGHGQRWISVDEANQRAGQDGFSRYRQRFGEDWVETQVVSGSLRVRLKPIREIRSLFNQSERFVLLRGEEITDHFQGKPIHINATNLLERVSPQGGRTVVETMTKNLETIEEQSRRRGVPILTHLNHPNFGFAITAEEMARVAKQRFFELYNGHPDTRHRGDLLHPSVERKWDIANTLRIGEMGLRPLYGLATDDAHHYFGKGRASPGRGWVQVRSRYLTPEFLINAMEAGDFYASTGVTLRSIQFDADSQRLTLEIEPQGDARYITRFIGTLRGYDASRQSPQSSKGRDLPVTRRYSSEVGRVLSTVEGTTAIYNLTGEELYVRAVVSSSLPPENPLFPDQRQKAWTQPVGWQRWLSLRLATEHE